MSDNEDRRLIEAYAAAVGVYSATVSRLKKDRGYLARADYSSLYSEAEDARHLCETARLNLTAYRESTRWL